MSNLLSPDNSTRNLVIFSISLLSCISLTGFYFMADRGCSKYTGNLATCTPFKCAQRVKGFENKNLGYHSATIRREIVGLEKDKYFATSTCNVIESDNIDGERSVICKYTDNTRNIASMRNAILFGTSAIPPNSPGDSEATKRAKFSEPTIEQKAECVKQ